MCAAILVAGNSIEAVPGKTIEENVRTAGLLPDTYLFIVDGRPVPMDTPVEDTMTVKAVKVASGG